MKPFFPLLIIATLLLTSCEKEQPAGNPAPPIAGFGNLSEAVVVDSFLDVQLLLNKPVETPVEVEVAVSGDAVPGTDFEIEGGNRFLLQPGMLNGSLRIRAPKNEDSERLDRSIHLRLMPAEGVQIAEGRDTLTIDFTLGGTVDLPIWAPNITFPQLWGYTSFGAEPVPAGRTNEFFAFAYASRTTPDVIGFGHPDPEKGSNAFNMVRIYSDFDVSSASHFIRIPEALRFIPANEGATFGTVEVIEQQVTITRTESSGLPPFEIGISGGGTYDEITGALQLDVYFDETAIGGPQSVLRKYVLESERR
jgi:hypothetical protein